MLSMESILGMVATEAIEDDEMRLENAPKLPAIRYTLELLRNTDGTYEWRE